MTRETPSIREAAVPLAALFVAAIALRPQLLAIGPLLPAIRADLSMSYAIAGLLGTIPVLCMGLFAPAGPRLAAAVGTRAAIGLCLAGIVAFGLLRAAAPDPTLILVATTAIGVSIGTAGAIPAIFVKLRAPGHPAFGTGSYAAGIVTGSTLAAALAVPLAGPDTDWRFALAAISLASIGALVVWLVLVRPDHGSERASTQQPRLPWRRSTAWLLVVLFGLQSMIYYGLVAWLANAYHERGWDEASAGGLLALMNGIGLVTTIGVPLVADRIGSRRSQLLVSSGAAVAGLLGVIVAPELGVAWAVILGLALGAVFPLVLTLPVDVADRPADVGATAALMLLGGYIISSTAPVLLGAIRDATGSFAASFDALLVLAVVLTVTCAALTPERLRHGVREIVPSTA
ncbi:MAG TPA: MFS transporter [Candidatus Limnocylindrales bacterium]|nr:MFS transporter [Candidatus Limnocylindrales bacterium]